ncbi:hypothetical protein MMC24_004282 [Lignoscripta atroalba]|nr:hypothetical protein [Lignoscripta atroalba]
MGFGPDILSLVLSAAKEKGLFSGPHYDWNYRPLLTNGKQVEDGDVVIIRTFTYEEGFLGNSGGAFGYLSSKNEEGGDWAVVCKAGGASPNNQNHEKWIFKKGPNNRIKLVMQRTGVPMGNSNHWINMYSSYKDEHGMSFAFSLANEGYTIYPEYSKTKCMSSSNQYLNVKGSGEELRLVFFKV